MVLSVRPAATSTWAAASPRSPGTAPTQGHRLRDRRGCRRSRPGRCRPSCIKRRPCGLRDLRLRPTPLVAQGRILGLGALARLPTICPNCGPRSRRGAPRAQPAGGAGSSPRPRGSAAGPARPDHRDRPVVCGRAGGRGDGAAERDSVRVGLCRSRPGPGKAQQRGGQRHGLLHRGLPPPQGFPKIGYRRTWRRTPPRQKTC